MITLLLCFTLESLHHATGVSLGVISKIHSKFSFETPKSLWGHPTKLTPPNISYTKYLIHMYEVDNTVQVTKSLEDVTNMSTSSQAVRHTLCTVGVRAVVKKKHPLLRPSHRQARLEWAERYKEYTIAD